MYFLPLHLFRLLLLLFFIAFFPCISHGKEEKSFHICYFSLNNEKEFTTAKEFTDKLNERSKTRKITVKEYLTEGEEPNESFQKMMDEGAKCDGLVISGHHTGSFGGKRSQGSLGIDFLEELACKPEYQEWFQKIQALWLQGCRTLGVKIEAIGADGETADDHTSRVGAELAADDLNQSFAELNMEFSGTLDQDNPLSTRYLRLFPHANVFGWTKSAPGEQARSHLSIPYHMAHIAYRLNGKGNFPPHPTEGELSEEDAALYTQALSTTLTALNSGVTVCEQILTEAWMHHGYNEAGSFHFINRDTIAYPRLFSSDSKDFLLDVKRIECLLRTANNEEDILSALEESTSSEEKIHYLLHTIYEKLKGASSEKARQFLLKKPILINFLEKKLQSKKLGILRKIDYYAFYRDLKEEKLEKVESLIKEKIFEQLEKPHDPNDWSTIDYNITLLKSLGKHDMLSVKDLLNIVEKTPNPYILRTAIIIARDSGYTGIKMKEILELVLKNKAVNFTVLHQVAFAIGISKTQIPNAGELLKSIIEDERVTEYTLQKVADAIAHSETRIPNAGEFLKSIMEDKRASSQTLNRVAYTIGISKTPIPNAGELLKNIIEHERATDYTLVGVASAIGDSKTPIPNAGELLKSIMEDKRASSQTLNQVAFAIGNSKTPIPNAGEFLKSIMEDERASKYTLQAVASAIANSKTRIPNAGELLKSIMEDKRATDYDYTLSRVAYAIGKSETRIPNAGELLKSIMEDKRASSETLNEVASAIEKSKTPILNAGELLKSIMEDKRATTSTLGGVARAIGISKTQIPNAGELLKSIIEDEKASKYTLQKVADAIANSETRIPNAGELLKSIIDDQKATSRTLNEVAFDIGESKTPILNAGELLKSIMEDKRATTSTLGGVARAIGISKTQIPNAGELLKSIIENEKATEYTLTLVASAIGDSKTPILNAGELLNSIMEDKRATTPTLGRVADAIGISKTPIPNAGELLKSIMEDKRATDYTLSRVADAIGKSKTPIPNAGELLKSIIEDKRASSETFRNIAYFIRYSETPIQNKDELLRRINQRNEKLPNVSQ